MLEFGICKNIKDINLILYIYIIYWVGFDIMVTKKKIVDLGQDIYSKNLNDI